MKLHKIILALTALMIIFGVLVNASPQVIPKDPPKGPTPPPTTTPPPPPPPPTTTTPPPPPPTTTPPPPPPPTTTPPPFTSPPIVFPPITPTPSLPPTTSPPSSSIPPSGSKGGLFPSYGSSKGPPGTGGTGLQPSGPTNDPTPSGSSDPTPQNPQTNTSQSSKDNHSNIKKAATAGIIVVGFFGISALIFSVYRHIQRRKDYANDITSSIYSTDEMSKSDLSPPYPFSTRTNSFSNNTTQQPPRAPVTNAYDNLPPIRNGGFGGPRPEYYNYYNEGGYMIQNRQNENVHIRNRLQQTRGNVMIQPPPPPPPQNYNWNYGVSAPKKQTVPMNQGGLFPVPYVRGNYGASSSNNMSGGNNNNVSTIDHTNNNNNYQVLTKLSVNDNDPKMDHRQEDIQALKDSDKSSANSKPNERISPNEEYRTSSIYSEPEYSTTSFSTTKTVQAELSKSPPEHLHERNDSYPDDDDTEIHLNAPIFKNNNNNHNR